jgi:hypothetical protein
MGTHKSGKCLTSLSRLLVHRSLRTPLPCVLGGLWANPRRSELGSLVIGQPRFCHRACHKVLINVCRLCLGVIGGSDGREGYPSFRRRPANSPVLPWRLGLSIPTLSRMYRVSRVCTRFVHGLKIQKPNVYRPCTGCTGFLGGWGGAVVPSRPGRCSLPTPSRITKRTLQGCPCRGPACLPLPVESDRRSGNGKLLDKIGVPASAGRVSSLFPSRASVDIRLSALSSQLWCLPSVFTVISCEESPYA